MKRISRFALLTMFSLLLLGGTRAFAGSGGDNNSQGQNNQGDNNQGDDNQGDNGCSTTPWANGGGGTAPIDGCISLLLAAGVGLGVRKLAKRQ